MPYYHIQNQFSGAGVVFLRGLLSTIAPRMHHSRKSTNTEAQEMAVGGSQKARLLSDYLIVPRQFFNFNAHVREELYVALLLIVTEQKIVAADTDSF
ncbi:MAG: hypothetical protein SFW62_07880 [Alphaproteobacteria bacterium]|nr:hypothetical protein [Alphaproteobacteria bacterium]